MFLVETDEEFRWYQQHVNYNAAEIYDRCRVFDGHREFGGVTGYVLTRNYPIIFAPNGSAADGAYANIGGTGRDYAEVAGLIHVKDLMSWSNL